MHEEKLESQKRRADFNIKKFLFVGSLFSIGATKISDDYELTLILYIVPAISICFDLMILGEDYGIKRIGAFIRKNCVGTLDSNWEISLPDTRDKFAPIGIHMLTILVLISCVVILWPTENQTYGFWVWLMVNTSMTLFLFIYSKYQKGLLLEKPKVDPASLKTE